MVSAQTLINIELFSSTDPDFRNEVAKLGKFETVKKGEVLFKQETYAKCLYVIMEGKLELTITYGEQLIDTLGPYQRGEMIGWSALVNPYIYTMGARAVEDSQLICFDGKAVLALMENDKENGYMVLRKLTEVIGERLVNSSIQLMSMQT
jgi:CRP/FNR family cyclic AMP-dependent transcriptional regulator